MPKYDSPLSDGLKKPESIKEVPGYVIKRITGFSTRLFYIIKLVWQTSPLILFTMAFFSLIEGILPVIGAYISKDLLNAIAALIGKTYSGTTFEEIFTVMRPVIFLLLMNFIFMILRKVIEQIHTSITAVAGELVVNHIKLMIINKAKTIDMCSFDSPLFYEKLENANREAGTRPINILNATFKVISNTISVASFIVVLATLSPYAPVIIMIAAIPGAVVNYWYRNMNFRYLRFHSKERREMNYYSGVMVNKDLAKEVKILGLGDTFIDKYDKAFKKYHKGLRRLIIKEGVLKTFVAVLTAIVNCALFAYVAYDVVFRGGEIGDYSLYTGALNSVATHVTTIVTATATIYEGTLFINNMIDYMKEEQKVVAITPTPRIPKKGAKHVIEFRNVSFSYPGVDRKVLDGINLRLESGDNVVLVGLNGAGKTTLIKLLTRLYDPTEGEIYLDGYDIREYDVDALHDIYGIIFQDFGKYAVTVSENISFGDPVRSVESAEVEAAATSANANDFIKALPNQYNTFLTRMFEEDGIELSGGQWQKLSVARAFYKDSDILILDEPTAALDALAEEAIFSQFKKLSAGKISVFVSHRLSSAVTAKKIVVLGGGKIIECGTHSELMEKKGEYYVLFSTQAQHYTGVEFNAQREGRDTHI